MYTLCSTDYSSSTAVGSSVKSNSGQENAIGLASKATHVTLSIHSGEGPLFINSLFTSVDDLVDVSTCLLTLSREHIFSLGLVLGLSITTLQPIRDSFAFLQEMLSARLVGKDNVGGRGGHTWLALVRGLRHPMVNQTELADRIELERCQ